MNCITSPALDNTEIAKYVDGEADEAVVAHIAECLFCREKASRWAPLQTRLKRKLYRASCPSPIELGDYHLGLLPAPQKLVIAQHVRGCPLCRREVAELENFLSDSVSENKLLGAVKVLIARLINQAENGDASVGTALRGEANGPLIFKANGTVIVLHIQPTSDGKANILGQIAADDQEQWTDAIVELRQDNELQFSTTVDDLGAFRSEGVTPGPKELRITSKDRSLVVLSNFEVST